MNKKRILESCLHKQVTMTGLATILIVGFPASSVVHAQEGVSFEEIVVTAQKREENPQDVGIAMNVFGGKKLNELGIGKTEDLANYVPNLNIRKTKGENYPTVTIRGVGLATGDVNYAISTSSTALHVDEVYFGSPTMMGFQLFDIERVEVLKGPQGTLYGRNSTAGSINYISKRPTEVFEGQLSAGWNNQNVLTTEGFVSGSLSDTVQARFAYSYENGDSYQSDLNGKRWDGPDRLATRTSLMFQPNEDLEVIASLTTGNDNSGIGRVHLRGISDNVWVADGNVLGNYDIDFIGGTVKVDLNLSDKLNFTSVTSYNRVEAILPDELDGEAIELQDALYQDTVKQFSQELRLSGVTERLTWVLGGYFFNEKVQSEQNIDFFAMFYDPTDKRPGVLYNSTQKTEAYAAFGQVDYDISEKFTIVLGLRYSYEKKNFEVTNLFNNFLSAVLGINDFDPASGYFFRNLNEKDEHSWDDFSGKVALNYKPNEDMLLYASVSNGFKSGGYLGSVTVTTQTVNSPGEPEDLTAYEVGLKSYLMDKRVRINLAGFYYDYKDMQVESIVFEGIVPFQSLVNVQKVKIQGIDLDITIYPSERLELSVGVGYTDGIHTNFVTDIGDFSGTRILNAPEWSVNSYARYDFGTFANGNVNIMVSHNYNSSIDFNFADRSLGSKGYNLFDAKLIYAHEGTGIEMSVWAKNITNKEVLVHAADRGDGGISELFLQPRRIGFGVTVPF